ncbi:hypothetical protein NVP1055O_48 [Vibrio phage 1.055.O._10N.286.55.E9]|nr:hypothetical protein NVP1055O_48 [Vibrio phage 1.055.O._10N.286.55.E9]
MAIFNRLTKSDLFGTFTHYATLHGVPIYYGEDGDQVAVRNGYPEWLLDAASAVDGFLTYLATMVNPTYDPIFRIKVGKPMFKEVVYVTSQGYVDCADGDRHFINHSMLRNLYRVECSPMRCVDTITKLRDWSKYEVIILEPKSNGDYTLPKPQGDFLWHK